MFETISSFIKKDFKKAYFLPSYPSTHVKEPYRFLNDRKYRVFDVPGSSLTFLSYTFPIRSLPAAGDEVPILMDFPPPLYLKEHWNKWLTAFPNAVLKTVDQGLQDDVPIMTIAALQNIPEIKHSVNPDTLYKLQLKSTIPEIGAPCPRHMEENAVEYPCMVKVDQSYSGKGNRVAKNESDLTAILQEIREEYGWKKKILFQEFIQGIKKVLGYQIYLQKSGEIHWIGAISSAFTPGYDFLSGKVDWEAQEYYRNLTWGKFTIPIANYLHKHGFFGFVSFEVIVNDDGIYLVDLNPRIGGEITHLLLVPFMAKMGYIHSQLFLNLTLETSPNMIVKKADDINNAGVGKVIVLAAASVDNGCVCDFSIFTKTSEELQIIYHQLLSG